MIDSNCKSCIQKFIVSFQQNFVNYNYYPQIFNSYYWSDPTKLEPLIRFLNLHMMLECLNDPHLRHLGGSYKSRKVFESSSGLLHLSSCPMLCHRNVSHCESEMLLFWIWFSVTQQKWSLFSPPEGIRVRCEFVDHPNFRWKICLYDPSLIWLEILVRCGFAEVVNNMYGTATTCLFPVLIWGLFVFCSIYVKSHRHYNVVKVFVWSR